MVPNPLKLPEQVLGRAVLEGVERAVDARWEQDRERAATVAGRTTEERVEEVRRSFQRELAAVGAASGGVAALPGAGTGTALAVVAADVGWYTMRLADLIMTIAATTANRCCTPSANGWPRSSSPCATRAG